ERSRSRAAGDRKDPLRLELDEAEGKSAVRAEPEPLAARARNPLEHRQGRRESGFAAQGNPLHRHHGRFRQPPDSGRCVPGVGGSPRLIDLAKSEKDPDLRRSAIHNLGLMHRPGASEALASIYASDANVEIRKAVVNALFLQQNASALVGLARNEKSPEMKKE